MTNEAYIAKIQELETQVALLTAQAHVLRQLKPEIHTHYHYQNRPIPTAWNHYQPYNGGSQISH